jgi:hypothetical protein
MGVNFIRSTAASHTKQWSAEYQHASADLFTQDCVSAGRSYIVSPDTHFDAEENEELHIRSLDDRVFVFRRLSKIGEIESPTVDLRESLHIGHGILDAFVDEVNPYARTFSVCIGKKGLQ